MSAKVEHVGPRKFRAYCAACDDGINTPSKLKATKWAYSHNLENHLRKDS